MEYKFYNPYKGLNEAELKTYRTNFHTHYGDEIPVVEILTAYKKAGYDIVMISGQKEFLDTGQIGKDLGITTINGMEYIEYDGILLIGIDRFLKGDPQEVITECDRQGGFAVVAHPNWISDFDDITALPKCIRDELTGYVGIEIITPCIYDRFLGDGYAADVWDELLSKGKRIWGFGNDDFHEWQDLGNAWNVIYARSDDFNSIKNAVLKGRFYVSTGLCLRDYSLNRDTLSVTVSYPHAQSNKITYRFIGENGIILQECVGKTGIYTIDENETYIRVEAQGEDGAKLWCQPLLNNSIFNE